MVEESGCMDVIRSFLSELCKCLCISLTEVPDTLPTFECSSNLELSQADASVSLDEIDTTTGTADTSSMIMEVEMDASD